MDMSTHPLMKKDKKDGSSLNLSVILLTKLEVGMVPRLYSNYQLATGGPP
jgi:hypothetical protein